MTSFIPYSSRTRDIQDLVERGVWGSLVYVPGAGASMSVRGTGTLDEEVPLLNLGYGFNLPNDSDAEMVMLSLGSDVNDKVVLLRFLAGYSINGAKGRAVFSIRQTPQGGLSLMTTRLFSPTVITSSGLTGQLLLESLATMPRSTSPGEARLTSRQMGKLRSVAISLLVSLATQRFPPGGP